MYLPGIDRPGEHLKNLPGRAASLTPAIGGPTGVVKGGQVGFPVGHLLGVDLSR